VAADAETVVDDLPPLHGGRQVFTQVH
jgi:hypothetical protein